MNVFLGNIGILFLKSAMKFFIVIISLFLSLTVCSESYRDLSFEKLVETAQAGDEVAMSFLAENYLHGQGVTQDYLKALKWYKKSAELNYAPAQFNLAVLLSSDKSLNQDLSQAFFWAEKAAEQNNANAQFLVASFFEQGKGTYKNKANARKWYQRAAVQDNPQAQFNLALMLLKGEGGKVDNKEGMKWLKSAARLNHTQAKHTLDLINKNTKG